MDYVSRTTLTGSVEGLEGAFPSSTSNAKAMMLHNMATVFCLRRENDKARSAVQQVNILHSAGTCTCTVYIITV